MNTKYMFDKLDIIKYRFLKEFVEASESEELTIYPMKSECKDQERKNFLSAIFGTKDENGLWDVKALWEKYYDGVRNYLGVKKNIAVIDKLENKENLKGIIFLDPDTGIKGKKTKEHLSVEEIDEFRENTVIIYQHRNRGVNFKKDIDKKRKMLNGKNLNFKIYVENNSKEIFFIVVNPENVKLSEDSNFSEFPKK
ncbi:MAG TPA: hypothetical protein PLB16_08235 [bacterium]|nr:hypothetical protein [bacterium]HQN73389.1 hypothetical protein [bacterium]